MAYRNNKPEHSWDKVTEPDDIPFIDPRNMEMGCGGGG
jgi:hypothetical protein